MAISHDGRYKPMRPATRPVAHPRPAQSDEFMALLVRTLSKYRGLRGDLTRTAESTAARLGTASIASANSSGSTQKTPDPSSSCATSRACIRNGASGPTRRTGEGRNGSPLLARSCRTGACLPPCLPDHDEPEGVDTLSWPAWSRWFSSALICRASSS
jgi:hypothetical protein